MENLRDIFINKAQLIHGNKWDYSKVDYINRHKKILIICSIHGEFLQSPKSHLTSKYPCPKCIPPHCIPNPNSKRSRNKNKPPRPLILPDRIINNEGVWIRHCPKCNKEIICKSKSNRDIANKHNTVCLSCHNIGRKPSDETKEKWSRKMKEYWDNRKRGIFITQCMDGKVYYNENGIWCRKCPQCKKEMEYTKKEHAIESTESNRRCYTCTGKGSKRKSQKHMNGVFLNLKKQWCRKCPMCDREIEYTSKRWALKAEKNKTGCYICYSSSCVSKGEIAFLDYFNIKDRQKQIGIYFVDGMKGNTVYEFLGDFWHGNPKRYNLDDMNNATGKTFRTLYENTIKRFKDIQACGYDVKYMWESDWEQFTKDRLFDNSRFRRFNGIDL